MKLPWAAGRTLTGEEFKAYYKHVVSDCRHCNIRPKEHLPLIDFPLLIKPGEWPKLKKLTEKLFQEVAALEQELLCRPELYESLGLPANILAILRDCRTECRPRGFARVMRFDFYFTTEGWRFSEANPDTAGGYYETCGLTKGMAPYYPGFSPAPDPAEAYGEAIHRFGGEGAIVAFFQMGRRVATWCSDFIRKEIEKRGMKGVLASPRRLIWRRNFAEVRSSAGIVRPNLVVRQLLANWLPNLRRPDLWTPWFCGSKTPTSNPGHSILVESKRLPVVCRELDTQMTTYQAYSTESRSPLEVPGVEETEWAFKPAFGSGGYKVGIAGITPKSVFKKIAQEARRNARNWVAQRRFESVPMPTERGPGHICIGIYVIDGIASGIFGRIRGKPLIDQHAMSIPVLISELDLAAREALRARGSSEKFNRS